jgi:hypothetical protein
MTVQNQAFDAVEAVATEEAKPVDPTLASIRQEREEAAAERARLQAEHEERQRIATKRALIGEVLNMQADIEKRYQAVKAQKKLLKGLRNDLKAFDTEDELTADDLRDLIKRGKDAFNVKEDDQHVASVVVGGSVPDILSGLILDVVKARSPILDASKFRRA